MTRQYQVAVIGAGVVGCAIARELAGTEASVVLIDARGDVGDGTSKANTAILHTGFDASPGTLESALVATGYRLLGDYARRVGIAVERTGAVLVAWNSEQLDALPRLADKAAANGYHRVRALVPAQLYEMVPHLGAGALGGLSVPDESIIDPWSTTLAFATDAVARGAELRLDSAVTGILVDADGATVQTSRGALRSRWVVNAAGLGSDLIDAMLGHSRFTVTPRRGELIVFDKQSRDLAPRIVLPVPTARGKGVLVSPTIFGNVMLGPTSEDLTDRTDTGTTHEGLSRLLAEGRRIMPSLMQEEVTATYAGLRAATEHSDYVIEVDPAQRYACVGGIRSTGLTASLAIAAHVVNLLRENGFAAAPRDRLPGPSRVPNLGEAYPRPYRSGDMIAADPAYGQLVCFCERVSRGEIRDALASAVPPHDLDGLRRRTRAMLGRCQGFYCGAEVERLLCAGTAT
ncbi:MAG TPA: NAD(P)/FAD-dependent oxidoreductase [Nakamurella sp.]|nr:NAD(P)/FAD-dependent oxidoreductase [Nakamurella sp.]